MLSDDSAYSITSQVTDSVTATYTHTLTVTGRLVGGYQCSVSNIRTPSGSSRSLAVVGKEYMVLLWRDMYTCKAKVITLYISHSCGLTHQRQCYTSWYQ